MLMEYRQTYQHNIKLLPAHKSNNTFRTFQVCVMTDLYDDWRSRLMFLYYFINYRNSKKSTFNSAIIFFLYS